MGFDNLESLKIEAMNAVENIQNRTQKYVSTKIENSWADLRGKYISEHIVATVRDAIQQSVYFSPYDFSEIENYDVSQCGELVSAVLRAKRDLENVR